jgi:hypothetical protein
MAISLEMKTENEAGREYSRLVQPKSRRLDLTIFKGEKGKSQCRSIGVQCTRNTTEPVTHWCLLGQNFEQFRVLSSPFISEDPHPRAINPEYVTMPQPLSFNKIELI